MAIRPIPYAFLTYYFENWTQQSVERYTSLFRQTLVGCESVTAEQVGDLPAGLPRRLEGAIVAASELDVEEDDTEEPDEEDRGMFAPPEEKVDLHEYRESDLIHMLTERGYSMTDIYGLLIPEIDLLNEGAERAEARSDDGSETTETSAPANGNRGGSHTALWN